MEAKEAIKANSMVKLTVSQSITRDELYKSLERILKHYGCAACGFNGWGLTISPELHGTRKLREELAHDLGGVVVNVEELGPQVRF